MPTEHPSGPSHPSGDKPHSPHGHSGHAHGGHHSGNRNQKRGIHKDWRMWVAVALMLGAMAIYVLSMDESIW